METSIKYEKQMKMKRPFVLAAIMLAMFVSAIEATIVSTAMPNITASLGGFHLYSWVFSAYLLMQTATVLIYGRLADLYGRKLVFVIGMAIFLFGSLLCGFATSMEMLILFRFIQGLGAGSVMTIATTIVGDIYTKEERSQIQGYLSSVWGISAVLGPALGAFFVQYVDWAYVFWMNIPLGILSIIGIVCFLHENVQSKKQQLNIPSSILIMIAVSALMLVLVEGGVRWQWLSIEILCLGMLCIICSVIFYLREKKSNNPIMHFSLWNIKAISIANIASFTTGMLLLGISSYLPAYVQGVMEYSPLIAGLTLTTMSIGWPLAATIAGKLLLKIGYKSTSISGGIALIIGGLMFVLLTPEKGPIWAGCASFFIGVGMGMTTTTFIVSIQSAVGLEKRGIATASNNFMRQLGSAIGAAFFGGLLNNQLLRYVSVHTIDENISINSTNLLLDMEKREQLDPAILELLQSGLSYALHNIYIGILILAIISCIIVFFMPVTEEQKSG